MRRSSVLADIMVEAGDEFSDVKIESVDYDGASGKVSDRILLSSPSPSRIRKNPLIIENSNFINSNSYYSTTKTEFKAAQDW